MTISRRNFMQLSAGAAAVGLGTSLASRTYAQDTADIRVAQIGFHGQGKLHIRQIHANLVALCDVDEKVLAGMQQKFKASHGKKLDAYTDFRRLLERDDIDAVSIATPNHTHALIAIAAAQAGKDVYVEKPVSHNVWEGRQLVHAARRYNRIIQCGTQSRSSQSLHEAVAFVREGNLGKIRYAIGTCYKPRKSIGEIKKPLAIPSHIDYDLWCGPAAKVDLFRPQLHYDWHWDFNTGCGDLGNQGIHQMDIARWFLGEAKLPPSVIAIGGRLGYEDAANTPNSHIAYFGYKNAPLIFETRGLPRSKAAQENWGDSMDRYRGSQIGVLVQCEKGHVFVTNYKEVIAYDNQGNVVKHWKSEGNVHHANWLEAVALRDRSKLNAEVLEGHLSSALCHLGNISYRLGKQAPARKIALQVAGNDLFSNSFDRMASHLRANGVDIDGSDEALTLGPRLELDPESERFTGNDQANELLTRTYRKSFEVPNLEG